jgi:hypothetical protein
MVSTYVPFIGFSWRCDTKADWFFRVVTSAIIASGHGGAYPLAAAVEAVWNVWRVLLDDHSSSNTQAD